MGFHPFNLFFNLENIIAILCLRNIKVLQHLGYVAFHLSGSSGAARDRGHWIELENYLYRIATARLCTPNGPKPLCMPTA